MKQIKKMIEEFVSRFGTGCSTEQMAVKVYRFLEKNGVDCCIVNDKYIESDGHDYALIRKRSKGVWGVEIIC